MLSLIYFYLVLIQCFLNWVGIQKQSLTSLFLSLWVSAYQEPETGLCLYYQTSQDEPNFIGFQAHYFFYRSGSAITVFTVINLNAAKTKIKMSKGHSFKRTDPWVILKKTRHPKSDISAPSLSSKPPCNLTPLHVQTHHSHACGQCHRGVDPRPHRPLVKAEVVRVVGPQALGAVFSQELDGEARCNQALRGLPQLHVEVQPQAAQPEVDCFTASVTVWWACIWGQGPASPPALMVCNFMWDVIALVVDLIWRYNLIFWKMTGMENVGETYSMRVIGNIVLKCNQTKF